MYYTIVLPWVPPEIATEWHPTDKTGPFARLNRGAFVTPLAAAEWARRNLNGTPYEIIACRDVGDDDSEPHVPTAAGRAVIAFDAITGAAYRGAAFRAALLNDPVAFEAAELLAARLRAQGLVE